MSGEPGTASNLLMTLSSSCEQDLIISFQKTKKMRLIQKRRKRKKRKMMKLSRSGRVVALGPFDPTTNTTLEAAAEEAAMEGEGRVSQAPC